MEPQVGSVAPAPTHAVQLQSDGKGIASPTPEVGSTAHLPSSPVTPPPRASKPKGGLPQPPGIAEDLSASSGEKLEEQDWKEGSAEDCLPAAKRRRYMLVRLDDRTGTPLRPATPEEVQELAQSLLQPADEQQQARGEASTCSSPAGSWELRPRSSPLPAPERMEEPLSGHHHLAYNRAGWQQQHKPGGPCDHCGAVESPQWRRGPVEKPVLCNACGTRYRRTNHLGVPASAVSPPPRAKHVHHQAASHILVVCES
eukprot:CAMPEP_0117672156 /NCGR_PEP_ID=MMETSP0804-20121206/13744_1 /TAXON_ID=1074897 /ORGANISM="Tetraselmis astigmatica, Strain CCMP880" /LENGTH=255 /DNA_ID=CAMNT_0005480719 /DNA_START=146 /DNA_END=913 /DNA_ORIENTATION=-